MQMLLQLCVTFCSVFFLQVTAAQLVYVHVDLSSPNVCLATHCSCSWHSFTICSSCIWCRNSQPSKQRKKRNWNDWDRGNSSWSINLKISCKSILTVQRVATVLKVHQVHVVVVLWGFSISLPLMLSAQPWITTSFSQDAHSCSILHPISYPCATATWIAPSFCLVEIAWSCNLTYTLRVH